VCAYVGRWERERGLHRLRVVALGGRYAELMFKNGGLGRLSSRLEFGGDIAIAM